MEPRIRAWCLYRHVDAQLETGPAGYAHRPADCGFNRLFSEQDPPLEPKNRPVNSQITGAFNEGISGARTSKTLVIEEHNIRDFKALTADMRQASIKTQMLSAIYIPSIMFLSSVATALVLTRGGYPFHAGTDGNRYPVRIYFLRGGHF